jgi:hypothetical protein
MGKHQFNLVPGRSYKVRRIYENSQYLANTVEEGSKWIVDVIKMFGARIIDKLHPTLLALKANDQVLKWMDTENLEAVGKKRDL